MPWKITYKSEIIVSVTVALLLALLLPEEGASNKAKMDMFLKVEYGLMVTLFGWYFWLKPLMIKDGWIIK